MEKFLIFSMTIAICGRTVLSMKQPNSHHQLLTQNANQFKAPLGPTELIRSTLSLADKFSFPDISSLFDRAPAKSTKVKMPLRKHKKANGPAFKTKPKKTPKLKLSPPSKEYLLAHVKPSSSLQKENRENLLAHVMPYPPEPFNEMKLVAKTRPYPISPFKQNPFSGKLLAKESDWEEVGATLFGEKDKRSPVKAEPKESLYREHVQSHKYRPPPPKKTYNPVASPSIQTYNPVVAPQKVKYGEDPKAYQYEYAVEVGNKYDKGNHKKSESQDSEGNVEGVFSLTLPDGRLQTTKYTANDKTGLLADVAYEGEPVYPKEYKEAVIYKGH